MTTGSRPALFARLARFAVGLTAGVLLVGGCAADDGEPAVDATTGESALPEPAEPEEPAQPEENERTEEPERPDAGDGTACDEVVAGIEAFNRGEYDETVARFEEAVPLAEAEDDAAGTARSADLLEAVRYYAELPADDYLEASLSSPDFQRYKAITLGQCGSGEPQVPGDPDDGTVEA